MHLKLKLAEEPFVLTATNEEGNQLFIDASPAIGGKNKGLRPMELLATALGSCLSIDILQILRKKRQQVNHFEVSVVAVRSNQIPAAFEKIELQFIINREVELKKLEQAVQLSWKNYCSVAHSIHPNIELIFHVTQQQ